LDELPNIELPEIQPGDEVIKEIVPHNEATNERSLARRMALQALYEIDSSRHEAGMVINGQQSGEQNADASERYALPPSRTTLNYMRRLVLGVTEHRDTLDDVLRRYASEFPLSQVAIIDRNILRIAVLEFGVIGTTPVGVAIDEAVELAKLFGAEGTPRFINGVLGSLADDADVMALLPALMPEALAAEIESELSEDSEGEES
jgi:N utilization substance protein B